MFDILIIGITCDMVSEKKSLKVRWPLILNFLSDVEKPACLIAHNGNMFDFKLLKGI